MTYTFMGWLLVQENQYLKNGVSIFCEIKENSELGALNGTFCLRSYRFVMEATFISINYSFNSQSHKMVKHTLKQFCKIGA